MNFYDLARGMAAYGAAPIPFDLLGGRGLRAELAEELENLLDAVWRAEREWALDDRIDRGWKLQQRGPRRERP